MKMQPIGTLFMKQIIDNQMIRMMKSILFFLMIVSFSRCDMKTIGYPKIADSTMQSDTSDLAITIVSSSTMPAYGLQKIIFSGTETNYKPGCEDTPYSECNSQYCYLPTYNSASRLHVYPVSDSLFKPVCTVYYSVGGKAKQTVADSISITPCKIEAPPGIDVGVLYCYWLRGCHN
jgi:hypothetical protein